jgi:toxin ParE1/3/4
LKAPAGQQIRWTIRAESQLEALHSYIAESNLTAADRQVAIVFHAVERLVDYPETGRPGRRLRTRELVISGTPYIVAYRIHHLHVEILAIIHGARRWPRSLE